MVVIEMVGKHLIDRRKTNKVGKKTKLQRKAAIAQTGILVRYRGPTSFGTPISLTTTMRNLRSGQCFVVDSPLHRRNVTSTASHVGVKVKTNKLNGGGLLVTML